MKKPARRDDLKVQDRTRNSPKMAYRMAALGIIMFGIGGSALAAEPYETAWQADAYCSRNMHALLSNTANLKNPRTEYCFGVISHSNGDETAAAMHSASRPKPATARHRSSSAPITRPA